MKLVEYKQYSNSDEQERTINKRKVIVVIVILVTILFIIITSIIYASSSQFRNFTDKYILMKNITENNLPSISIDTEKNINTYAYYNYVTVLDNNELILYNASGKEEERLRVTISSPIFASQDNYLVVAEKNQQKVYLIKDKKIMWEKNVEGQISRISVNESGLVSVIVFGTTFKSVITTYLEDGSEVFKTFLSNTLATDVDISKDNKYLSFCEIDLSGTLIKTKVKTISIDKAKQDPDNSIIFTYEMPADTLVTNLEYHEKDELICISDNKIYSLKNGNLETLADLKDDNITFVGIQLSKSYFKIIENVQGINNQVSDLEIFNTTNKNSYSYTINGIAKEVYSQDGVVAVNLGSEVYFINEMAWLIKKYTSSQEIRKIVVSQNIAGIIYRNKIEFISL